MSRAAAARDELTDTAADAAIEQACRILRLPTIRARHAEIAAAATRQQAGYKGFLVELLAVECDDRETRRKARLVRDAGFPRTKRLEDFDYAANPNVPPALIHTLARCAWVATGQPLCLIGDSGTGKSHLLIGLGEGRLRDRPTRPLRHYRRPGQRTGRGRRRTHPVTRRGPLWPHATCSA